MSKKKDLLSRQCFFSSLEKFICISDCDRNNLEQAITKQTQLVFQQEKVGFYQGGLNQKLKYFSSKMF